MMTIRIISLSQQRLRDVFLSQSRIQNGTLWIKVFTKK